MAVSVPEKVMGVKGEEHYPMPASHPRIRPGSDQPLAGRCGSKLAGTEPPRYCKSMPSQQSQQGRCRMHGGTALTGPASPAYKDGTRSTYIPARLAADYWQSQGDPEKLALKHEISFWYAREQELSRRIDQGGDPVDAWATLQDVFATLETLYTTLGTSLRQKDPYATDRTYRLLGLTLRQATRAIQDGQDDHALFDKIQQIHDFTSKLKTLEHRRILDLQQSWSSEQVSARFGQFMHFLWEAATEILPPEYIRPYLSRWHMKMKTLNAEWVDRTPLPVSVTPDTTPAPADE